MIRIVYLLFVLLLLSACKHSFIAKVARGYSAPFHSLADTATHLNLRDMNLHRLPKSVLSFKKLESLEISQNPIHTLPTDIHKLEHLEELQVNHSVLKELPPSIGKLKEVRKLGLLFADIEYLPNEIGNLNKLEELNLNGCPIRTLPDAIYSMKSLKRLYVGQQSGGTLISQAQLDSLKLMLPNCKINY